MHCLLACKCCCCMQWVISMYLTLRGIQWISQMYAGLCISTLCGGRVLATIALLNRKNQKSVTNESGRKQFLPDLSIFPGEGGIHVCAEMGIRTQCRNWRLGWWYLSAKSCLQIFETAGTNKILSLSNLRQIHCLGKCLFSVTVVSNTSPEHLLHFRLFSRACCLHCVPRASQNWICQEKTQGTGLPFWGAQLRTTASPCCFHNSENLKLGRWGVLCDVSCRAKQSKSCTLTGQNEVVWVLLWLGWCQQCSAADVIQGLCDKSVKRANIYPLFTWVAYQTEITQWTPQSGVHFNVTVSVCFVWFREFLKILSPLSWCFSSLWIYLQLSKRIPVSPSFTLPESDGGVGFL